MEALLAGDDRMVKHPEAVRAGLDDHKSGRADFPDSVIAHINRAQGCEATAIFDEKAAKLSGFVAAR